MSRTHNFYWILRILPFSKYHLRKPDQHVVRIGNPPYIPKLMRRRLSGGRIISVDLFGRLIAQVCTLPIEEARDLAKAGFDRILLL
jgi:hypothetical protein